MLVDFSLHSQNLRLYDYCNALAIGALLFLVIPQSVSVITITGIIVLYELPLVAVLSITGNINL